jgi:hypothetical protein
VINPSLNRGNVANKKANEIGYWHGECVQLSGSAQMQLCPDSIGARLNVAPMLLALCWILRL